MLNPYLYVPMTSWRKWFRSTGDIMPFLVPLLLVALFFRLGYMELRGEEARRALVAMEMLFNGDFLVPTLHGLPYINKPPFYQWLLMAFFSGPFQISESLIRIPGVLSAILTAVAIWWVGRHWLEDNYARLAGWMYLTAADLIFFGLVHAGEIDPFYALVTFMQIALLWLVWSAKRSPEWLLLSFLLAAVGILTKGLPSVFHQGVSILALAFIFKRWKLLINPWMLTGMIVMVAVPASYFLKYSETGDSISYLINLYWESVKKSGAVASPAEIFGHILSFPLQFAWLIFPWSLALVFLVKRQLRYGWWSDLNNRTVLLMLMANLTVYWLSPDTRNRYLYPFLPWLVLLIVPLLRQVSWPRINMVLMVIISFRLIYSLFIMPVQSRHFPMRQSVRDALEITKTDPVHYLEKWDSEGYDFSIPGMGQINGEMRTTPSLHYKIPFYFMQGNGQLVRFDTVPDPGTWYITRASAWTGDSLDYYFTFPPKGNEEPLILARKTGTD